MEWRPGPVRGRQWILTEDGVPLAGLRRRFIQVHEPYFNDPDPAPQRYGVTGGDHGHTEHTSLEDAKAAAEASLS